MVDQLKWYERPMRMAAIQTAERSPGIRVLKTWKNIGFNVEQLLHAIGDGYFAAFDPSRHAEILKAYVAEARRLDIRIILYLNTHLLSPRSPDKYEEWGARTMDGNLKIGYGTYAMGCVNTPWADFLVDSARQACLLGVDGIFSDGPVGGCHCQKCKALFASRYGDPDVSSREYRKFTNDCLVEFMRKLYEGIKSANPEAICYQNLDVHNPGSEDFLPYNDIVGSEGGFMFYGPPQWGYLWRPSITAKMLQAVARGKSTVIFAAADQKSWSLYPHAPGETKLLFASSVANGANVWYGMHFPPDLFKGPSAKAAWDINAFLRGNESCYESTVSAARVALMYSYTSASLYSTTKGETDFYAKPEAVVAKGFGDISKSFHGFAAMLYRAQIPFDVVTDTSPDEQLARYDCIILPTCPCLSDAAVERIRKCVARGGNLVSSFDMSLFDDSGRMREDFALAHVLGVKFERDCYIYHNFDYFAIEQAVPFFKGVPAELAPSPLHGLKVSSTGARALARFHAPLAGCYVPLTEKTTPAVLYHEFGKGKSLYLAGSFGEFYNDYAVKEYKTILANAVGKFSRQRVQLLGAPESLEVTHRVKPDGSADIIHLVNYTGGMSRPILEAVPLNGLELRLRGIGRVKEVRWLSSNRKLRAAPGARGELRIALPPVHEYEVIAVTRS